MKYNGHNAMIKRCKERIAICEDMALNAPTELGRKVYEKALVEAQNKLIKLTKNKTKTNV